MCPEEGSATDGATVGIDSTISASAS
eukprot:COSAG01_NODE_45165_length_412_cov_0.456869_1_plen_25_part_01